MFRVKIIIIVHLQDAELGMYAVNNQMMHFWYSAEQLSKLKYWNKFIEIKRKQSCSFIYKFIYSFIEEINDIT